MKPYIVIWDYQLNTTAVCPNILIGEIEIIIKKIIVREPVYTSD